MKIIENQWTNNKETYEQKYVNRRRTYTKIDTNILKPWPKLLAFWSELRPKWHLLGANAPQREPKRCPFDQNAIEHSRFPLRSTPESFRPNARLESKSKLWPKLDPHRPQKNIKITKNMKNIPPGHQKRGHRFFNAFLIACWLHFCITFLMIFHHCYIALSRHAFR